MEAVTISYFVTVVISNSEHLHAAHTNATNMQAAQLSLPSLKQ